jgi:mannose-6-phosphate isomerase-like protein (cupin superfamily)
MTFSNLTNTTAHADTGDMQITFDAVDAATANSTQDAKLVYPTAETNYRVSLAIVPTGSKFHPGAHWHEDYDEVMRVVKGRAKIRLGSTWKVYGPEDGKILIKRGVVHDLMRADVDAKPEDRDEGDLVMEEWSEPCKLSSSLLPLRFLACFGTDDMAQWTAPKNSSSATPFP